MRSSKSARLRVAVVVIISLAALPCFGGEVAVLKNGFSIRHERREVVGEVTRLYVTADGSSFVDVPTSEIEHYEAAPDLPESATQTASNSRTKPPLPAKDARDGAPGATGFPGASAFARSTPVDLNAVVNAASGRYRLDPDLVDSVIKAESGFNVRAVSPKGAQGLMQLMPGTASQLGVPDVFDPQANVEGGTKYLRELLERYNFDLVKALAAYNAGPQRVEQFGGVPPYYETRVYVARVVRDFNKKKAAQKAHSSTSQSAASKTKSAQYGKPASSGSITQANVSADSVNK